MQLDYHILSRKQKMIKGMPWTFSLQDLLIIKNPTGYIFVPWPKSRTQENIIWVQPFIDHSMIAQQLKHFLYTVCQLNNCTRENKTWHMLAYLENLVDLGFFQIVEYTFLPIGHTDKDIDQPFSRASQQLWSEDIGTLWNLLNILRRTYDGQI